MYLSNQKNSNISGKIFNVVHNLYKAKSRVSVNE